MALVALASAWSLPASALACEGQPGAARLTVQVGGVRSAHGEVAVTLYPDEPQRFLAPKGKLLRVRTPAGAPVTTACFFLPGPGYYAVAVYHDENGDHDFNRTLLGLPTEGFGFSNDPSTKTGLPPFKAVRFQAGSGETGIRLKLRYLK
ncbi:DUF2141 domain-containing protein [Phenylobacterium sp.]|jgi:uncharacterized protein (DUF2141 family)|uniref:DUF2141 domain-containing protein n=1 Tax=Phenylobacterium sp. TaxID=1871053 RepID=UPI002F3F3CDB